MGAASEPDVSLESCGWHSAAANIPPRSVSGGSGLSIRVNARRAIRAADGAPVDGSVRPRSTRGDEAAGRADERRSRPFLAGELSGEGLEPIPIGSKKEMAWVLQR